MNKRLETTQQHVFQVREINDRIRFYKERINRLHLQRQKAISGTGLKRLSIDKAIETLDRLEQRLSTQLKIAETGDFETYDRIADWHEATQRQLKALKKSQRKKVNLYEFSYELIDAIKDRVTLVDMLNELKIKKKRSGADKYVILCPFHDERTPSCMIYVHEDKYHCFGCTAHGDVIDFYQNYLDLEFDEAITRLCDRLSIQVMDADQVDKADQMIEIYKSELEIAEQELKQEQIRYVKELKGENNNRRL